ncbi:hypothetical protein K439DRAFT_1622937 [Ramaria rubella]|nr:hypothetical protein K439DRAFT_1622937 [Ramaria rubella]
MPTALTYSLIATLVAQSQLRMQPTNTGFDQPAPMNLGRMPLHPDPTFLQPLASASGSTPPLGNNPMLVICINNFWEVGAPIRNRSGELGVVPGVGASIWRQFHSPGSPGWVLKYSERYSRRSKKTLLGIKSTCGRRCLPDLYSKLDSDGNIATILWIGRTTPSLGLSDIYVVFVPSTLDERESLKLLIRG